MRVCPKCGARNNVNFCPKCGTKTVDSGPEYGKEENVWSKNDVLASALASIGLLIVLFGSMTQWSQLSLAEFAFGISATLMSGIYGLAGQTFILPILAKLLVILLIGLLGCVAAGFFIGKEPLRKNLRWIYCAALASGLIVFIVAALYVGLYLVQYAYLLGALFSGGAVFLAFHPELLAEPLYSIGASTVPEKAPDAAWSCPNCGAANRSNQTTCGKCGSLKGKASFMPPEL